MRRVFALLCVVGTLTTGYGQENFESLLHRGYDLHQQARFAEAVPILEQAHKLAPQDYFANLLLGIDLLRVGKASQAIAPARQKPRWDTPLARPKRTRKRLTADMDRRQLWLPGQVFA